MLDPQIDTKHVKTAFYLANEMRISYVSAITWGDQVVACQHVLDGMLTIACLHC
jgi:hypothetical protein